jgi:hypothetical protein
MDAKHRLLGKCLQQTQPCNRLAKPAKSKVCKVPIPGCQQWSVTLFPEPVTRSTLLRCGRLPLHSLGRASAARPALAEPEVLQLYSDSHVGARDGI